MITPMRRGFDGHGTSSGTGHPEACCFPAPDKECCGQARTLLPARFVRFLILPPFQRNSVIGGMYQVLAGAEVAFGSGNGGVAEQQLDVFELSAGGAAEFGAGAAQVVRLDFPSEFLAVKPDQ